MHIKSPLLLDHKHPSSGTVTRMLKGPKYLSVPKIERRISSKGKPLRRKPIDPKANIKWKGDEAKRLKVCTSALMQMRLLDQVAYSGMNYQEYSMHVSENVFYILSMFQISDKDC